MTDAELTDADREYARRWAAARRLSPRPVGWAREGWYRWPYILEACERPMPELIWEAVKEEKWVSESAAWYALAVVLRDLRRAVEIPAGPPSSIPHEAAA